MKIEIWSDIMCPFCYIGKRRLEKSLINSPLKDSVEIEWKSYQINPELVTDPNLRIVDYLAIHKGISLEQARQMNQQVSDMGKEEGLLYDFENSVVANSLNAHQLAHFAKKYNKQDDVEEILFRSYFTDCKNIDDMEVLKSIAQEAGLDSDEFQETLSSRVLEDEVKMDIHEARQIGVKGVPFFVYNRKYAISGAQPVVLFEETLNQAFEEWKTDNPLSIQNATDGGVCGIDGCE